MVDYFDLIDDYIANSLSQEEKVAFEKELEANASLKHAVENYKTLKLLSASLIETEVNEQIKKLSKEPISTEKKNFNIFKKWAIAAGIITIIGCLFLLNQYLNQENQEKYFVQLYEKPTPDIKRGGIGEMEKIDSAIYLFTLNKFDEAETKFNYDFKNDSLNIKSKYFRGHIALIQKQYDKAIPSFIELSNNSTYSSEANYNLLLCYIFSKRIEEANDLLKAKKKDMSLEQDKALLINDLISTD